MYSAFRGAILVLAMSAQTDVFAQSTLVDSAETLEEVVVIGRTPGPPLWKVSNGEHVLWILPLIDLYPKEMEWDTRRLEKLVSAAQEFISPPAIGSGFATKNPLLIPRLIGLRNTMVNLPDKVTLADVLQPDLYQRFATLKARYFPKNSRIERLTVSAATSSMLHQILERENLRPMWWGGAKWLRRNKEMVRTVTTVGETHVITGKELTALIQTMKEVRATPGYSEPEISCFEGIVAYFERDTGKLKRRANAWAEGRVDDLADPMSLYRERTDCLDDLSASAHLPAMQKLVAEHPGLAAFTQNAMEVRESSRQKWLDAARRALSQNATTFSMLHISDIVDKTGLVTQLEEEGYKVEVFALQK